MQCRQHDDQTRKSDGDERDFVEIAGTHRKRGKEVIGVPMEKHGQYRSETPVVTCALMSIVSLLQCFIVRMLILSPNFILATMQQ